MNLNKFLKSKFFKGIVFLMAGYFLLPVAFQKFWRWASASPACIEKTSSELWKFKRMVDEYAEKCGRSLSSAAWDQELYAATKRSDKCYSEKIDSQYQGFIKLFARMYVSKNPKDLSEHFTYERLGEGYRITFVEGPMYADKDKPIEKMVFERVVKKLGDNGELYSSSLPHWLMADVLRSYYATCEQIPGPSDWVNQIFVPHKDQPPCGMKRWSAKIDRLFSETGLTLDEIEKQFVLENVVGGFKLYHFPPAGPYEKRVYTRRWWIEEFSRWSGSREKLLVDLQ